MSPGQLQVYLNLAFTAEYGPTKTDKVGIPAKLIKQLQSSDLAILNEAVASIWEKEEDPNGPLHQNARQILVQAAQNFDLEPIKRIASADSADYLSHLPDNLYSFIPIPNNDSM